MLSHVSPPTPPRRLCVRLLFFLRCRWSTCNGAIDELRRCIRSLRGDGPAFGASDTQHHTSIALRTTRQNVGSGGVCAANEMALVQRRQRGTHEYSCKGPRRRHAPPNQRRTFSAMRALSTSNAESSSRRAMPGSGQANWERPASDILFQAWTRACCISLSSSSCVITRSGPAGGRRGTRPVSGLGVAHRRRDRSARRAS